MKKILSIILAASIVLTLAACGSSNNGNTTTASAPESVAPDAGTQNETEDITQEETEEETEDPYADIEKEIVVGITNDPSNFYPWGGFNIGTRHIFPMIYQTLLSDVRDPDTGEIVHYHALMDHYEKVDETTYMIYIYDGIYDTEGNPFTAKDVCFSFTKFKEGPSGATLMNITSYEAIDDTTVKCEVSKELGIGEFEEMLTTPNMVTQAAFEASPDEMNLTPVGTTGYRLDEYVPGSYATVVRSDLEYWNQAANDSKDVDAGYLPTSDTNYIDKARFEVITDTNTMAIALETNAIDIASSVAAIDIPFYQSDDYYTVHMYPDNMFGLVFNCSSISEFNNINLRKALAYSVSAQDLLDTIYDGDGFILHAYAMDYQMGYVSKWDDQDYFTKDTAKAKEYFDKYLSETGKSAQDLHFNLIYMSTDPMTKYAQVVQGALIELTGNKDICSLTSYDSATYATMRNAPENFDLAILNSLSNKTYILYNWQVQFNGYQRSTGDDLCFTGDEELWRLQEAAQQTLSEEDCDAFQQRLNDQCYFVNYICGPAYWAGTNVVEEYVLGAKNSIALCAMKYNWSAKY